MLRSVILVLTCAAVCQSSPSDGGQNWLEKDDEPVLDKKGQIDDETALGARVEHREIGAGTKDKSGVDRIIRRNKVLTGSSMLPVSLFDGKMHKKPDYTDQEQKLLVKFVTSTKLSDFTGPCDVPSGEDPSKKCPIRTLFAKIKQVCGETLKTSRTGQSALKKFEEPEQVPDDEPEDPRNALMVDVGWGKIQDHNYGKMVSDANAKFKKYFDTQVKALQAACRLKIKEANSGVEDFLQVQDNDDPVGSWDSYWEEKVAALYPRIVSIGAKAREEQITLEKNKHELAALLAGDRAAAKKLGLFVPTDPNEPTGYERDMNKNREVGQRKEGSARRLQQLVSQWIDEVYGTQERLKESCLERLKALQAGQPKGANGMQSQLNWPQGINPSRAKIPKPFDLVQTSDVNSETALARSVTANLILADVLEEYTQQSRIETTYLLQAEWGGQDMGLNTDKARASLEKLKQEWENKFKKLKAVVDNRCAERVSAAKASVKAKEMATKNSLVEF